MASEFEGLYGGAMADALGELVRQSPPMFLCPENDDWQRAELAGRFSWQEWGPLLADEGCDRRRFHEEVLPGKFEPRPAKYIHDWQAYVPDDLQRRWDRLSLETRAAVFLVTEVQARKTRRT